MDSVVGKRFSRAAVTYHQEAELQKEVANEVALLTKDYAELKQILDLGCGTGFLTEALAKLHPQAEILGIDIAEGMVGNAEENYGNLKNVKFAIADGRTYEKPKHFQLVASASSLQWMLPISQTFQSVRASLASGGKFIFSLMVDGSLQELHSLRADLFPRKLPKVMLPKLLEIQSDLEQAGFEITTCDEKVFVRDYPNAESFFANLYNVGVTSGDYFRAEEDSAGLNRTELLTLVKEYQQRFEKNGKVTATYNVGFVVAEV